MGEVSRPEPVNLICAVLAGREDWLAAGKARLVEAFGPIDLESEHWPFRHTDYYREEMGGGLIRVIYSFQDLIGPGDLAAVKHTTNRLEKELAGSLKDAPARPLNLDPGYVEASKMVLATTKNYSHRVYLGDGIYGESTLRWRGGRFEPWEWTYPDYSSPGYMAFFARVRGLYREKQ
ncbi:MAG: DUF4416 family protein [Planctomycetes bacterium]|nr:DUF4416 family protein [Planctomycetota bacterium]